MATTTRDDLVGRDFVWAGAEVVSLDLERANQLRLGLTHIPFGGTYERGRQRCLRKLRLRLRGFGFAHLSPAKLLRLGNASTGVFAQEAFCPLGFCAVPTAECL